MINAQFSEVEKDEPDWGQSGSSQARPGYVPGVESTIRWVSIRGANKSGSNRTPLLHSTSPSLAQIGGRGWIRVFVIAASSDNTFKNKCLDSFIFLKKCRFFLSRPPRIRCQDAGGIALDEHGLSPRLVRPPTKRSVMFLKRGIGRAQDTCIRWFSWLIGC
jgi:hypothetical protein